MYIAVLIYSHECASGFYRVSTYFLSKIFCDFIPMRLIPLCFFSVVAYFMIGLLPTCQSLASRPNVLTTAKEVCVFVSAFVYQRITQKLGMHFLEFLEGAGLKINKFCGRSGFGSGSGTRNLCSLYLTLQWN